MSESDDLTSFLCAQVFELQGRLHSAEVQINALLSVISENAPDLVPALKEKIADVSELKLRMEISDGLGREYFERGVNQAVKMFDLYAEGAKYSPTSLVVKKS